MAFRYSSKGLRTYILSKPIKSSFASVEENRYRRRPDVLERVRFRYVRSTSDIVSWCHTIHNKRMTPHIIILNGLEEFAEAADFSSYAICASLIDAMDYCARNCSSPTDFERHLLIGVNKATYESRPAFLTFFEHIVTNM